ncbi:error-prone DNA polymerase [Oceaniradius stylonematis]|jgi:error-prone DNA polymerase|uniref:error-prone DNA polymerase n=1 Tax=Oceaniradius stylonematis TaxID=2184161 RepID=UPI000D6C3ACF
MNRYAELAVSTNFSFLRGASHPGDFVMRALELGLAGIGIADRNTVAGVVRGHSTYRDACKAWRDVHGEDAQLPLRYVVGARLVFADDTPDIIAYPENRAGWGRLCRLLTLGKRRAEKGGCLIHEADLLRHCGDLLLIVMPPDRTDDLVRRLSRISAHAPGAVWLAASMACRGDDRRRLLCLKAIAGRSGIPLIAVGDALYHDPGQRPLQDVVTCIREGCTLDNAGYRLQANAERHLKTPDEVARLFRDVPEAVAETVDFLARIDFSLDQLTYQYPEEPIPPGKSPQQWLEELVWRRAPFCYPDGIPDKVAGLLEQELALIAELDYAQYFLTIHDIVRFADDQGILCQGRGSAANSAVCYVLGITAVDPAEHDLLFARFISSERKEPPDIDVDFEHERREEVIQHIYQRYGRERAGIAATVISYRPRSAIREVGKALGLTEDVTARLASTIWGSWGTEIAKKHVREAGIDPDNPVIGRAIDLATQLLGFPRHLSQHVGGFVLTRDRLDDIVPIGNAAMDERTFIEWDKDDIDALGLMKVDVLGLGMLTCIRKCMDLMRDHCGRDLSLADFPPDDQDVYAMLQRGESIGVFQVESRAQINMLPRLKPKEFYDLVIQVAIVRPGPIQGDMVHPYLRRRNGEEDVVYPAPSPEHGPPDELRKVLDRTKGVPLFQEQAMKIAMVAARFSPEEANGLRRAMATFRHVGTIQNFEDLMVERMVERGYEREFAERCFNQIKGFGEYGFPESHAASFAKLVYISSWIKHHEPAVFACGLLNAQPMGFYAPAQIVRDAQENGIEVRAADINRSQWDNTLERAQDGALALRLGFRQIDGFHEDWADRIAAVRGAGFDSAEMVWRRARLEKRALKILADADAFRSIGLDRRDALWAVRRLPDDVPLPLFEAARRDELSAEPDAALPAMKLAEHVVADYQTTRLSLKSHPMALLRPVFAADRILSSQQVADMPDGKWIRTAGVVLIRQRPGKGNAIFMTLEDETGIVNVLVWARRFERFRRAIMGAKLAVACGHVQKSKEGVIHLIATSILDRTLELNRLSDAHTPTIALSPADEVIRPQFARGDSVKGGPAPGRDRHPRDVRIIPKSRDFH